MESDDTKYKPFRDVSFLIVFIFGLTNLVPIILSSFRYGLWALTGKVFLYTFILFIIWGCWIVLKKGTKGSLLTGFVLGLVISYGLMSIMFYAQRNSEEKNLELILNQTESQLQFPGNESISMNTEKVTELATATLSMSFQEAVNGLRQKYEDKLIFSIISTSTSRVWFDVRRESDGCSSKYKYVDITTGEETVSTLDACSNIYITESYPFYVEDCSFLNGCYDFKTLYVVNLLTFERKVIHKILNQNETTLKKCYETNYDSDCSSGITIINGKLNIPVYKSKDRKPYEIYENGEPIRVDTVDLWKEFSI